MSASPCPPPHGRDGIESEVSRIRAAVGLRYLEIQQTLISSLTPEISIEWAAAYKVVHFRADVPGHEPNHRCSNFVVVARENIRCMKGSSRVVSARSRVNATGIVVKPSSDNSTAEAASERLNVLRSTQSDSLWSQTRSYAVQLLLGTPQTLRQHSPERTDLPCTRKDRLGSLPTKLNQRIRQTFDWETPAERLNKLFVVTTA